MTAQAFSHLPTRYEPHSVEADVSRKWEDAKAYHVEPDADRRSYSIVMPPPNVTGALHMGHALNNTLQDILIRWRRMQGYNVLWMPGTDHAGIATQAVIEKRLQEHEGKTRHDIGREKLVERIWQWKDAYAQRILGQLRALGASCDWDRTRFTLDAMCSRAVRRTFFDMFRDGLIYRGKRLVNWDTRLQTAVADDEVYHETQSGHLWHIRYPLEDGEGFLVVATTRPETMLGDTAVAVHPDDERYRHLIGRRVRLPLVDRRIPVVGDAILVDRAFGSGCVKVTPAHDDNDYQTGQRHKLAMINVLHPDGTINENGGRYRGMDRERARRQVVQDLQAAGLVDKIEDYQVPMAFSDRSKTPIEPYLSDQWFVRMGDLAERAMQAVRDGAVRFHPARYAKTYLDWLGEKRDWCISRQLWWGHRIPIWSCTSCSEADLRRAFGDRPDVVWRRDESRRGGFLLCALEDIAENMLGESHRLERDPDVLDTWFSSALWPHSTMGWPEDTVEMRCFYPTHVLSTGRDIISLWVARMVIMSQYNLGKIPFAHVYVHANIQDGEGRRMSKSLGNGVDPLDVIAHYGADALRYTLAALTTESQDIRLLITKDSQGRNISPRFELGRNFANKLWNASRFLLMNLEGCDPEAEPAGEVEDRWIHSRMHTTIRRVTECLDRFHFSQAAQAVYDFFWHDFCDWYVERAKPRLRDPSTRNSVQVVLLEILETCLKLLHPVMPYITERVYLYMAEGFPDRFPGLLMEASWPVWDPASCDETLEREVALMQELVRCVREIRNKMGILEKQPVTVHLQTVHDGQTRMFERNRAFLSTAANLTEMSVFATDVARPPQSASGVVGENRLYIPLEGLIDLEKERARIQGKMVKLRGQLQGNRRKLSNRNFLERAPAEVVAKAREQVLALERQLQSLEESMASLRG